MTLAHRRKSRCLQRGLFPVTFFDGGPGSTFSFVKLLCPFNGSNGDTSSSDLSGTPATLTFQGASQLSSAQAKFGATSLLLSGATSQYVTTNRTMGVTTGQFTMECHARPTAAQTGRILSAQDLVASNPVLAFRVNSTGSVTFILRNSSGGGTVVLTTGTTPISMTDSAWFHIAATRDGSNAINIWVDGTSLASTTSATSPAGATPYTIGALKGTSGGTPQEPFAGYLDNLRLQEGRCEYTASFTPPAGEYPTS